MNLDKRTEVKKNKCVWGERGWGGARVRVREGIE